jgi:DNA topoisomerase-1
MKTLVIVESPAKAPKIAKFLGDDYIVMSSVGHIRDLPQPKDIPRNLKKQYGKFSVDLENDFKPYYAVIDSRKRKVVMDLKKALQNVDRLYLATDEDREGESIAWHIVEELKPKIETKRMVFHEITKSAVKDSLNHLRDINMNLVNAQESRRILDRLYGYSISPILWRKIAKNLSAGRVQSPALKLIVERELERMNYISKEYFDIEAAFDGYNAKLFSYKNKQIAGSKDFNEKGELVNDVLVLDRETTNKITKSLKDESLLVTDIQSRSYRKSPSAPFTTASLQQEALNRLNMSSSQTMECAQKLYENGYITYMRTDSNQLSQEALTKTRELIESKYGKELLNPTIRAYQNRSKNAQEAHEAIRPAGDFVNPADAKDLNEFELKLYILIYRRTIASQMVDCEGNTTTLVLEPEPTTDPGKDGAKFKTSGTVIYEKGFTTVYEGLDKDEQILPKVQFNEKLKPNSFQTKEHETKPPARYTDATLVKKLEDLGIGRPATYAAIIQTLLNREYVKRSGKALIPSWPSFSVTKLMKQGFPNLVDYDFTRDMENSLDDIANGVKQSKEYLKDFYFGEHGLKEETDNKLDEIDTKEINTIEFADGFVVRTGKYGTYIENPTLPLDKNGKSIKAYIKDDMTPDELNDNNIASVYKENQSTNNIRNLGTNPENGNLVTAQDGRYGPYVTEHYEKKQIHSSLLKTQDTETITLEEALQLLRLPIYLGDNSEGKRITVHNGPYGPYVKCGSEIRSLESEAKMFTVTLEEALAILAVPKQRRGRIANILKNLGKNTDGLDINVQKGRYGEYVTDGKTNVTIPRGTSMDSISLDKAIAMIEEKAKTKGATISKTKAKTKSKAKTKTAPKTATKAKTAKK